LHPLYAHQIPKNIEHTLLSLHPHHKKQYTKNYQNLKKHLQSLHQQFKTTLSKPKHKQILVSHPAYPYSQNPYPIHQISLLPLSPSQHPSQKQLQNIVQRPEKHHIQ
uniref:metal ABC transporter solute-binding protein, Zn/Mn family n=1 Tax=Bacillus sp. WP8 TaxID=756828 RepID=UPI001642C68F